MRYAIEDLPALSLEIDALRGDLADRAVQCVHHLNHGDLEEARRHAKVWHNDRERLMDLVQEQLRLWAEKDV